MFLNITYPIFGVEDSRYSELAMLSSSHASSARGVTKLKINSLIVGVVTDSIPSFTKKSDY